MNNINLPNFTSGKEAYTPIGVRNCFDKAVLDEKGDIASVLNNKHKYKQLLELYNSSFLALAIKKWIGKEFAIYPSDTDDAADSDDVYFIDQKNIEAFSVQITELYQYKKIFDNNYMKLAQGVYDNKGTDSLPLSYLLIVNRIISKEFNVSKFIREMTKFNWGFERIWFAGYTANNMQWTFSQVYPTSNSSIGFNIEADKELFY